MRRCRAGEEDRGEGRPFLQLGGEASEQERPGALFHSLFIYLFVVLPVLSITPAKASHRFTLACGLQVLLSFYEVKNRQASWFTNKVERLYWEQWHVNLHVLQPSGARGKPHGGAKPARDPGGTATAAVSSDLISASPPRSNRRRRLQEAAGRRAAPGGGPWRRPSARSSSRSSGSSTRRRTTSPSPIRTASPPSPTRSPSPGSPPPPPPPPLLPPPPLRIDLRDRRSSSPAQPLRFLVRRGDLQEDAADRAPDHAQLISEDGRRFCKFLPSSMTGYDEPSS